MTLSGFCEFPAVRPTMVAHVFAGTVKCEPVLTPRMLFESSYKLLNIHMGHVQNVKRAWKLFHN